MRLNNKKIIRALSLGIVSLGVLVGLGLSTNNYSNAHAMSSLDQERLNEINESGAKDDAISDANEAKDRITTDKVSPSDRISDEYEEENWRDNRFSKIAPAVFNGNYVKGSKADQKKDAYFINKYMKHQSKHIKTSRRAKKVTKHHYNKKHNKATKSHRAKKANRSRKHSKRTRAKKSKHLRLSKRLSTKLNKQLRHDKKALKSRRAKHSYKYRKSLNKVIKKLQTKLRASK